MGTLREDLCTFLIISHSVLLRMRNVSDKSLRENRNTHFMFSNFFQTKYSLWDNVENIVEPERPHITIWCMCICCWIPYCFPTATIVAWMRLNVTLYVHCINLHYFGAWIEGLCIQVLRLNCINNALFMFTGSESLSDNLFTIAPVYCWFLRVIMCLIDHKASSRSHLHTSTFLTW
jgi:hypothetical protein